MSRSVIALAAGAFVFAFVILAYGLYQLFGNVAIYAAAGGVVVGMFIYLVDAMTTPKAPK